MPTSARPETRAGSESGRRARRAAKGLPRESPGHRRSVAGTQQTQGDARTKRRTHSGLGEYLRVMGPGLVTGASDDDPSGIATYAQAGAQFRFGLLWLTLVSLPLMSGVQEICDRTALATGQGLGDIAVRSNVARIESHPFYDRLGYRRVKTQHAYRKRLMTPAF